MWLGVAVGNLLWVAASILVAAWTLWFGIGLARSAESSAYGSSHPGVRPA